MDDSNSTNFYVKQNKRTTVLLIGNNICIENPPGFCLESLIIPYSDIISVRTESKNSKWLKARHLLVINYVSKGKKWRSKEIKLRHSELRVINKWKNILTGELSKYSQLRPKRLLVYINPFGGKGTSPKIFREQVRPLMDLAGIECVTEITKCANYARDDLMTRPLTNFDGVICVGGDGMFSEIFNGILLRCHEKVSLRVGVIPGGSTDAIALSLHGTSDVETCVLHIILGDELRVDVSSIYSRGSLIRYSMTIASYGYFGDLLKRSERLRWIGPRRYDISGMQTLLRNKSYEGMLTYKEDDHKIMCTTLCTENCSICTEAPNINLVKSTEKVVKGRFMSITAATMKCACKRTPKGVSPSAHLGDGYTNLILINRCSRWNYLNYLLRTGYSYASPFDLSFVQVLKVREFTFETNSVKTAPKSVWNCDGEIIEEPNITIKVHCQVLPVFARGIPDHKKTKKNYFRVKTNFKAPPKPRYLFKKYHKN